MQAFTRKEGIAPQQLLNFQYDRFLDYLQDFSDSLLGKLLTISHFYLLIAQRPEQLQMITRTNLVLDDRLLHLFGGSGDGTVDAVV